MRSSLPFLAPFAGGALVALYLFVEYDDSKAGVMALMLAIATVATALVLREETTDRELGPRLATLIGAQSLEPRWAEEILGPWWGGRRTLARWIVAREESWGSLFLLRLHVGKNARETHLVLSTVGAALPTLSARRKGPPRRELDSEPEEWDVTAEPGAGEEQVSRIVQAAKPLEIAAFQIDGKKLWCRVRDPGVAYLADNAVERERALLILIEQAAELGRELGRVRG